MNEEGKFADQAANILETKNIGKDTVAYKSYSQGKLPKAHITARAMRWTEKIFLSHLFEEMYRVRSTCLETFPRFRENPYYCKLRRKTKLRVELFTRFPRLYKMMFPIICFTSKTIKKIRQ